MYNFMYKNKGAISIFLIIIFVPMLVISSIFVDMSRIRLANSVAASAGDLTLNTALTNYDAVLKEMYGLFATSQDMDELYENLENYYSQCIEAAGIPDVEAENYVDQIMSLVKSETGTDDLMNMNLTSFSVSSPTGSNLANPAVLKSQIVEFMKYRAPINLGTSIIEAVKSMKNLKAQTTLVDNKNKFYTEQASMMESLEEAWGYIEDYQFRYGTTKLDDQTVTFPNGDLLNKAVQEMNENKAALETAISYTVRYLYYAPTSEIAKYEISAEFGEEGTVLDDVWKISPNEATYQASYSKSEPATAAETVEWLNATYSATNAVKVYTADDKETGQLYHNIMGAQNLSTTQKAKYVSEFNSSFIGNGYVDAVKKYIQACVYFQGAYETCDTDPGEVYLIKQISSGGYNQFTISEEKTGLTLKNVYDSYEITEHLNLSDPSDYLGIFNAICARAYEYQTEVNSVRAAASAYVKSVLISTYMDTHMLDDFLQNRIDCLTQAISKLTAIKKELDTPTSNYNKALSAWKTSADSLSSDSMGQADQSEIAKLEKVLTSEKVEKLITRLTSAKTSLEDVKNDISLYKLFSKKWIEIGEDPSGNLIKSLIPASEQTAIESIEVKTGGNKQSETVNGVSATYDPAYNDTITVLQAWIYCNDVTLTWEDSQNPDLTKNQIELYTWLYNNFDVSDSYGTQTFGAKPSTTTTTTKVQDGKDDADATQQSLESSTSTQEDPTTTIQVNKEFTKDIQKLLPSGEWKAAGKKIKEAVKEDSSTEGSSEDELSSATSGLSMFDGIIKAVTGMATDFRDNMYVANYIMNMFSYSTFEAELVDEYKKNYNKTLSSSSWYKAETKDGKTTYVLNDEFKIEELQDEAKTLTRVGINPNTNYLYGEEIEYIIYGNTNATASAYGTIYMLRFALNTVYAFTDAEINSVTTAAATAIFGTPPLTPLIPVAKVAFTIALALAESAWDLCELKWGRAVPLIKNNKTWVMKPSTLGEKAAGTVLTMAVDTAIDKGYEVLDSALEMTDEELTALINSGKDEFGTLLKEVEYSTMSTFKNYANEALTELVNICNNINLLEMEVPEYDANGNLVAYVEGQTPKKIDAAVEALKAWLNEQGSSTDDAVYEVKKVAVDYLLANQNLIGDLFDKISNPDGKISAEALGIQIDEYLREIRREIEDLVDGLTEKVGSALNNAKRSVLDSIETAAKDGAESLRSALKDKIGATFGTSSSKDAGTSSVVNSLLSWRYSNYLELFLLIGIIAAPESILLRTADVIQLNRQQVDGTYGWTETEVTKEVSRLWGLIKYNKTDTEIVKNESAYQLSKAYTHLQINATIEVRPLMMTLPLMADTVKSQVTGTDWYQIEYKGILGY